MIFLDRSKRFDIAYVGKGGGLTKDLLILSQKILKLFKNLRNLKH